MAHFVALLLHSQLVGGGGDCGEVWIMRGGKLSSLFEVFHRNWWCCRAAAPVFNWVRVVLGVLCCPCLIGFVLSLGSW